MSEDYKEKLRTLGWSLKIGERASNKKPVIDDRDGSVGGYEVEHWDDHQDAHVMAKTVAASLKVNKPEEE